MRRFFYIATILLLSLSLFACKKSKKESKKENIVFGINADDYTLERKKVEPGESWGKILGNYGIGSQKVVKLDQLTKDICPLRNIRAGSHYTAFTHSDSTSVHLDYLVYEKNIID